MGKPRSADYMVEQERLKDLRARQRKEDRETGRSRPKTFVGPQPEQMGPRVPSAKSVRIGRAQAKARGEKPSNFMSSGNKKSPNFVGPQKPQKAKRGAFVGPPKPKGLKKGTVKKSSGGASKPATPAPAKPTGKKATKKSASAAKSKGSTKKK
jgi:hypothetical protein